MTLFIEDGAPVIVQGMTGHQGMTHTARMLKAGTNIVGGVNARKAGLDVTFPEAKNGEDATIHVFANCSEAIEATGAKASVVFVPPRFAADSILEAEDAGIELIVIAGQPVDRFWQCNRRHAGKTLVRLSGVILRQISRSKHDIVCLRQFSNSIQYRLKTVCRSNPQQIPS